VIATTGAEPHAEGGYAAVLLLDARALLERPGLRAGEEALRRWCNAAALARPGAPVVVTADQAIPAVQALMRWDPAWFSSRELAERDHLGLPPAVRMAALTGDQGAVAEMLSIATVPTGTRVLGPVPAPRREATDAVRALLSVSRRDGMALARALHDAQAIRSAHRSSGSVEVRVDPMEIG
jgi:primosomal protein N' (replication factor Y)